MKYSPESTGTRINHTTTLALGFLCLFGASLAAQDAPKNGSISGSVLDSLRKQPVRNAEILAQSIPALRGGRHSFSATSDAEGNFEINDVSPGQYAISAYRTGYVGLSPGESESSGKLITVIAGQKNADLMIELATAAAIAGSVKDKMGKPIAHILVQAMSYFYSNGQKQIREVGDPAFSGAAGEYRIAGLPVGRYLVRAMIDPLRKSAPSKPSYLPAYYPGARRTSDAEELPVRPGEDLGGINFTLKATRTVKVAGRAMVSGPSTPAAAMEIELVEEDGVAAAPHQCVTDFKGFFELEGVIPGEYVLLAHRARPAGDTISLFGRTTVHVANSDQRNALIWVRPGATINGQIHVGGDIKLDLSRMKGRLESVGAASVTEVTKSPAIRVEEDGNFVFADVADGTYLLDLFLPLQGYYLKPVGSMNALETPFVVERGQSVSMEFVLNSKLARLTGKVSSDQNAPIAASVILVPEGVRSERSRYYRQVVSDQSGAFRLNNIFPGDYKLYAFEEMNGEAYLTPDFLRYFADQGKSVHLSENDDLTVSLAVISSSETQDQP
jgi:uncharacterized protein (DUF2141 family)